MIKRGWHSRTGFVYSDWLSFGSELGQHLLRGNRNWVKTAFFPLSPRSGHQRHSRDRENRGICGNFYFSLHCETLETFPQKGLASELFAEHCLHWGLCPQSSLLVFGTAFVLGMEPLVWLSSVFMEVVALPYWIGFITTWWLFFISEALPYSLISFYISILLILCIWYIYKYKIRFTFVFLRFSLIP